MYEVSLPFSNKCHIVRLSKTIYCCKFYYALQTVLASVNILTRMMFGYGEVEYKKKTIRVPAPSSLEAIDTQNETDPSQLRAASRC